LMFASLSKVWTVTKAAWAEDKKRPKSTLRRQELAFLPAAVEVVETPASPVGRGVALTLMAVVVIALIWAWFGRIDTVAVAQGRIIPGGQVKTIQPVESAVVAAIHVKEGDQVQAGDLLLVFDPTDREVDKGQVTRELAEALLETTRLSATLAALDSQGLGGSSLAHRAAALFDRGIRDIGALDPTIASLKPLIETQRARMRQDLLASQAKMEGFDQQIGRQAAAKRALLAELRQLRQTLPLLVEREAGLSDLLETGTTERWRWLEVKQALIETRGQLNAAKHRIEETDALTASLAKERQETGAAYRQQLLADLSAVRAQADLSRLALRKAEQWEERQYLHAPVDGIVQQ
ncbi:MAG: biotin/lipoyl-binding protein, partial [Geminicoccaceae bacterium]